MYILVQKPYTTPTSPANFVSPFHNIFSSVTNPFCFLPRLNLFYPFHFNFPLVSFFFHIDMFFPLSSFQILLPQMTAADISPHSGGGGYIPTYTP
jgi:hypothetical protein